MDFFPPPTDIQQTTSFFVISEILGLLDQAASLFWAKKYKVACFVLSRALQMNKEMLVSEMRTDNYSQEQRKGNDHSRHVNTALSPSPSSWSSSTAPSCSCKELLSFVMARSDIKNDNASLSPLNNKDHHEGKNKSIYAWQVDRHRNIHAYSTLLVVQVCKELLELFDNIPSRDIHLTLSLIIIFNMALSQHFYALDQIKEGCSSSRRYLLLSRSYLLYNHAKELLRQLQLQSCWFLSLVVLNNEAQLLLMMGEHQEASSLFQFILSYICHLNLLRREGEVVDDIAPVAALEAFVHNTSYMILKEVITAAAA